MVNCTLLEKVVQPRALHSHKGDYGRLLLIGGTYPFGGAIIMAALATVHSGAGLVTVATDRENIAALHAHLPEAMAFDVQDKKLLTEQVQKADVVLIGSGLAESKLEKAARQIFDLRPAISKSTDNFYPASKRMGAVERTKDS